MQIINGNYYKKLSENNRIRSITIPPLRGLIYDRYGHILARNVPSFSVGLVEEDIPDMDKTIKDLSSIIGLSAREIKRRIEKGKFHNPFSPVIIKEDIPMKEVALIESLSWKLRGVTIVVEGRREYPYGSAAAHVLGYVGEITKKQLDNPGYRSVPPGSIIGQSGIEKVYDRFLRGKPGTKNIEVDATGRERRVLNIIPPASGDSIILTLDIDLQRAAEKILGDHTGSVVVMDSQTGDILAMVSHPSYDPNILSRRLSWRAWRKIARNPHHPLTNRAIQGIYPPGSIFKIVMATAALEDSIITPWKRIFCNGALKFGHRIYRDWKAEGHGHVNMYKAIAESCDVYFYQLGLQMDIDTIAKYANMFGLGKPTGIDLPAESKGLIPTREWKLATRHDRWYPGETLSVSIGQGFVAVTPLQQTIMVNAIATSGYVLQPRLLKGLISHRNGRRYYFPPVLKRKLKLRSSTLKTIKRSLLEVVNGKHGTGKLARSKIVDIAGKTGTAQVVGRKYKLDNDSSRFRDHAWFTGFAPYRSPKIIVTVIIEHGGHGGSAAAPVAKYLIEEYYKNRKHMKFAGNRQS